jgi:hypothetical protein
MTWLQGKKTIIGGGLVMVGAVLAVALGRIDPSFGTMIFGVGASIAGMGDKANRHQAELLVALGAVAKAGIEMRAGQSLTTVIQSAAPSAQKTAMDFLRDGIRTAPSIGDNGDSK